MAGPSVTPAAPGRADPGQAAPPVHRRLEIGACAFFVLMQCAVWLRSAGSLTVLEHVQTALIVAHYSAWLGLAAFSSDAWWRRWRRAVAASRVLIGLLPITRSLTVGAAVMLGRPATPGLLGAGGDYLRVGMGTRVLQLPLTGLLLQQPPLALLLEHAVQSALLSSNALYCRSVLLQDPLSRRRMAWAWAALDWLPQLMPLSSLRGSGAEPDGWPGASDTQCIALLNMHQLCCGVLLPVVAAALLAPHGAGQQMAAQLQQPQQAPGGCAATLQKRAARLWAAAESALWAACRGEGLGDMPRVLLACMFLGNCWLLCQVAAGRNSTTTL
ncbi:hypothetical protein ABPG77_004988 [Micractinium sp. CCAP 211/92]